MKSDRTPKKLGWAIICFIPLKNRPPKKVGVNRHFQASWVAKPHSPIERLLLIDLKERQHERSRRTLVSVNHAPWGRRHGNKSTKLAYIIKYTY